MRDRHVCRSLSGLVVFCLLGALALAAPATTSASDFDCDDLSTLQQVAQAGHATLNRAEHAAMQAMLGQLYAEGQCVAKDERRAAEWFQKAAEQGDADAQFNLGVMYDTGRGVAKDERRAAEWYRKAAEQGSAEAQFNLGASYYNGQGVTRDRQKAVEWFRKAAAQGNERAKEALRKLGEL